MSKKNGGFGARLNALLSERGAKKRMCDAIGLNAGSLQRYLGGQVPEWENLLKLSHYLKVSTDYLLTGDEPSPPQVIVSGTPISAKLGVDEFRAVPLVDEQVAAGPAIEPGPEEIKDWVVVYGPLVGRKKDLVAVRIRGDSMEPVLPNGSIVIVDRNDKRPKKGSIFVVRVDGGVTAKYVEVAKDEVVLVAENREFRDLRVRVRKGEESPVVGKVIWSWRSWG